MRQALFLEDKRSFFSYEPLGRRRRDRPLELPLVDPVRRGRDRPDRRQRRRAQAGEPDAAAGRADPRGLRDAGFPEGLVRTVHGGGAIGQALCEASTAKIFFTGSVEVGRKVGEICAERMKGSVLELGGKDPQIVCADADLANAVSGCVWGGFANAGQTCSGIERTYVVEASPTSSSTACAARRSGSTVGDPLEWETEIGPMVSAEQADRHRAGRRRDRRRRRPAHGRAPRPAGLQRPLHRADRARRRHRRDVDHERGDLRPGRSRDRRRRRGRGPRARQRLELRARRLGLDDATAPRASGSRGGSSRAWCGSTTTPTRTARCSAPGAASRTRASGARTRSSASTSA